MNQTRKSGMKSFSLWLRVGISCIMLMLVLRVTDFSELLNTIESIPPIIALTVIVGYILGPLLNCYRWLLFARAGGVVASYSQALRAYFIGAFVNFFGLGTVGGDVTRGLLLAGTQPVKAQALASVAADRLHGLAMLALVGSSAALFFGSKEYNQYLMLALGLLGPAIIVFWFLAPTLLPIFLKPENNFRKKLEAVLSVFPRDPKLLLFVCLLSVIFHCTQIGLHKVMGIGLGVDISWATLLIVVPFVNIVSSLPISWQGLGVRENAYMFFLVPHILSKEQAIAFGAMWLLAVSIASSIGGVVSVLTGKDIVKE